MTGDLQVWVISDIESSAESHRLEVGDTLDVPAVLFGKEMSPASGISADIEILHVTDFLGGGGIPVVVATVGEGSTAIVDPSTSVTELREHRVNGYFYWEPYWYANYIGKSGYVPEIHARVVGIANISTKGNGHDGGIYFLHDPQVRSFRELDRIATDKRNRIQFRCMQIEILPRRPCAAASEAESSDL